MTSPLRRIASICLAAIAIPAGVVVALVDDNDPFARLQAAAVSEPITADVRAPVPTIPPSTIAPPPPSTTAPPPPPPPPPIAPPPAPPAIEAAAPVGACWGHADAVAARWPVSEQATGCRIIGCESGGNPTAQNARSSASGVWQFLKSTWAGYGGYAEAWQAPASVQHDAAYALWLRSGWSPWACA